MIFITTFSASMIATLAAGIQLVPDVSLYVVDKPSLYPSPGGTFIGAYFGVFGLAVVHAVSVATVALLVVQKRAGWPVFLASLPVLWWVLPLGVDTLAALLVVVGVKTRSRSVLMWAGVFHLAAFVYLAASFLGRSKRGYLAAALVTVSGFAILLQTPYGGSLPTSPMSLLLAFPQAVVVLGLGMGAVALGARIETRYVVATSVVVLYATTAHVESGISPALSIFAASRYVLPLTLVALVLGAERRAEQPTIAPGKETYMMRFLTRFGLTTVVTASLGLLLVGAASAQTVPAVPVAAYGNSLLASLATAITAIFPYAAAITAFAIAVGMVKRWLGHRKATRV